MGPPSQRRLPGGPAILLQLNEQDIRGGVPNLFAVVFLGRQPTDRTSLKLHLSLNLARDEPSLEGAQRAHDAVGMLMRSRLVARLIRVLKNADPLVLENNLVVLRVAGDWIEAHTGKHLRAGLGISARASLIYWDRHALRHSPRQPPQNAAWWVAVSSDGWPGCVGRGHGFSEVAPGNLMGRTHLTRRRA